jgi:2-oxoglutarate ferredoxin oxidoreductase subunit alpha
VDRLSQKWNTAKELVPQPVFFSPGMSHESEPGAVVTGHSDGVIFFGTSAYAAVEALEMLAAEGITLDGMRPRGFPFGDAFLEFVEAHERLFVIEQNRDAQFRSLMLIELGTALSEPGAVATGLSSKLISVLNYDGMPITADNIFRQIKSGI